jgi:hypothetical protein
VKRDETIGGVVLLLFGLVTVILSLKMPIGTFRMAGTGLFPLCLGILLTVLSGIFILRILLQAKEVQVKRTSPVKPLKSPIKLVLFLGTILLVILFFNQLGYLLSSFILILALVRILGVKNWRFSLPLSLITAIACYLLFVQWLKIPLPKGWIGI